MNFFLAKLRNRYIKTRYKNREQHPLAQLNLTALDHINLSEKARSFRYVVVDLETTGLNLICDRVVSIGAFRVVDGHIRLGEMFNKLVNPRIPINSSAIKIHGIVPDMVAEAESAQKILKEFLSFLGTDILVAHYASIDLYFLNKIMKARFGFPLQNLVLDTVLMCRKLAYYKIFFSTQGYPIQHAGRKHEIRLGKYCNTFRH